MRRKRLILLIFCAAILAAGPLVAEVVRTLRLDVSDAEHNAFVVENLVGTMHVSAGTGEATAIIATVHAESEALANAIRLERIPGGSGPVTVHVQYPENERTLRYPHSDENGDWVFGLFSFGNGHQYQGRTFRVGRHHGRLLFVDLEVRVPARIAHGTFRNLVGRLDGEGLVGTMTFEVESSDLRLERLRGEIDLHGSSGDIRASDIAGTWRSEFTSGDCLMHGFQGESLSFHTTSGDVETRDIQASRLRVRTASGDYAIEDADIEDFEAESTSGNVQLDQRSPKLARVRVEATSGDVLLRLPRQTSFEAIASATAGDIRVDYDDVTLVRHDRDPATYRHGHGGAQIWVKTTSGNLTIQPR